MQVLNLHHAKAHLSRLVEQALAGEEIIIARAGKPMVKLTPCQENPLERKPGALKGQIWMSEDFNAPLSEKEQKLWYEGNI